MAKLSTNQLAFLDVGSTALGALSSGIGGFADAIAGRRAAKANARMYEAAAVDALDRGEQQAEMSGREYAQARGSARASFGARNVALDEGSPAAVVAGIEMVAREDAAIIRKNATREADGYRMQAYNARVSKPGFGKGLGSLLSGAGRVAKKWYAYQDRGVTPGW